MFDLNKINVMGSAVDMLSRFILLGFCHLYWEMEEGVYSIQLMMNHPEGPCVGQQGHY